MSMQKIPEGYNIPLTILRKKLETRKRQNKELRLSGFSSSSTVKLEKLGLNE